MLGNIFTKDLLTQAHEAGLVDLNKHYKLIRWISLIAFWILSPAAFVAGYLVNFGWFLAASALALTGIIGYRILPKRGKWLDLVATIIGISWFFLCLAGFVGSLSY